MERRGDGEFLLQLNQEVGEEESPSLREGDILVLEYHRTIQKGVILFGKEWGRVRSVYEGNKRPISITTVHSKMVIKYKPDIYFKLKNGKLIIFEILQSELDSQDKIIADVIRSFLVDNVAGLVFIYPTGYKRHEDRILEALTTVYGGLIDKGTRMSELPTWSLKGEKGKFLTGPLAIKQNEFNSPEEVNLILQKVAKNEKW